IWQSYPKPSYSFPIAFPESLTERPRRWLERHAPDAPVLTELLEQVQYFLGKEGYHWFSACAVYPELRWQLTLYLGYQLKLLTEERLAKLARLPWLRYGYMPDWLREQLVDDLSLPQQQEIRTILYAFLQTASDKPISDFHLEIAPEQKAELSKSGWRRLSKWIKRAPKNSPLRDYVFLTFMEDKLSFKIPTEVGTMLGNEVPKKIKLYINNLKNIGFLSLQVLVKISELLKFLATLFFRLFFGLIKLVSVLFRQVGFAYIFTFIFVAFMVLVYQQPLTQNLSDLLVHILPENSTPSLDEQSGDDSALPPSIVNTIERLLRQCKTYLDNEKAVQAAATCYKQVLEQDKDNALAKNGLKAVEFYDKVKNRLAANNITVGQMEIAKQHLDNLHSLNSPLFIKLEQQWIGKRRAMEIQYQQRINRAISAAQFVQARQYLDELRRLHSESPVLSQLEDNLLAARNKSELIGLLEGYQALIENALDNNELNKASTYLEKMRRANPTFSALPDLKKRLDNKRLENKYMRLVKIAINAKQFCQAHQYLDKLRRLNPNSLFLPELEKQIKKVFRDRLTDDSQGPKMVWIPAGRFLMGSQIAANEQPVHRVSVKCFAMSIYEVTFAEYDRFAEATGRQKPNDSGWERGKRPVINVDWEDATAYAEWLNQQTGQEYRLPTEAEWEYAARAGTETRYWWGNDIGSKRANCKECGSQWDDKKTAPVGSFAANFFGLHDTVGNVYELTCSEYQDRYEGKEQRCLDKNNTDITRRVVIRGGAWDNFWSKGRAAYREWYGQHLSHYNNVGFRLVRE
ncbi:MAG: hypothetical protein DRR19_04920, partial [Candidatus Parabeggiatoa sp. nov. 1]